MFIVSMLFLRFVRRRGIQFSTVADAYILSLHAMKVLLQLVAVFDAQFVHSQFAAFLLPYNLVFLVSDMLLCNLL